MSKNPIDKLNYAVRREMRIRRDKTAAMMMQALVAVDAALPTSQQATWRELAERAVKVADLLLDELARTDTSKTLSGVTNVAPNTTREGNGQ